MSRVLPAEGWRPLGHPPPGSLGDARRQLHWAVQIVAAVGSSLVEPRPDDSHTSLSWRDDRQLLAGEPLREGAPCRAALRLSDLTLHVLDERGSSVESTVLEGLTLDQGLAWMSSALIAYLGGPLARGITRPDHEMPDHELGRGARFPATRPAARQELARWFANADRSLPAVRVLLPTASPPRCWPHHFDLALLATLDPGLSAEDARSVGLGLSPGDESYDEPYWYVTPWPCPEVSALPGLEGGGRWHREGWTSAVLTASDLVSAGGSAAQAGRTAAFLDSAIRACLVLIDAEG